jgi:hypothetical protein
MNARKLVAVVVLALGLTAPAAADEYSSFMDGYARLSGATFTGTVTQSAGQFLVCDGVTATPCFAFVGDSDHGLVRSSSGVMDIVNSNNVMFRFNGASIIGTSNFSINVTNANADGTIDTRLFRDAANTWAQRNGTNAQEFRFYKTDNGANDSFFTLDHITTANTFYLGQRLTGTGTISQRADIGTWVKTLTDATIATFSQVTCPSGDAAGVVVTYVSYAENGTTEAQQEVGKVSFNCINLAGTESFPAAPTKFGTLHHETTGGTADMTTTFAAADGGANLMNLRVTVDTGIAAPTLVEIRVLSVEAISTSTLVVTPQ